MEYSTAKGVVLHLASASRISVLILNVSLHSWPRLYTSHINGLKAIHKKAINVAVQPIPIRSINGFATATAPAPSRHRDKLLAATAVAGLWRLISTTNVFKELNEPVVKWPVKNSITIWAARAVLNCMIHPWAMMNGRAR